METVLLCPSPSSFLSPSRNRLNPNGKMRQRGRAGFGSFFWEGGRGPGFSGLKTRETTHLGPPMASPASGVSISLSFCLSSTTRAARWLQKNPIWFILSLEAGTLLLKMEL